MNFNSTQVGPRKTPKAIKIILASTAIVSLLIAIVPNQYLNYLLGMSMPGIENGFYWQLVTNIFIVGQPTVSFNFVFHLIFNLYIIWTFGTSIIELKGTKAFLYLFIISSLLSSVVAFTLINIFSSSQIFVGGTIFIYVISMGWLMLHNDAKILLLFTIPFKAKWLILGAMGLNLISLLSNGFYVYFFTYLSATIFAYIISLIMWQTHSPFAFLKKIERNIINIFNKRRNIGKNYFSNSKIYDFKTGEPIIDDEEFIDAMLSKISLQGEESLTKKERKRMEKISKKKKNPK